MVGKGAKEDLDDYSFAALAARINGMWMGWNVRLAALHNCVDYKDRDPYVYVYGDSGDEPLRLIIRPLFEAFRRSCLELWIIALM